MTYHRKPRVYKRRKAPLRKRIYRKRKTTSVVAIVKKQMAKTVEKKVATPVMTPPGLTIAVGAQSGLSSSGWQALDVNPDIPVGSGASRRIGSKVNICSFHFQFQLAGQENQYQRTTYKIMLILRKNNSTAETPNSTVQQLFLPNPFTGLIDSNSSLDVNQRSNYQILRSKTGVIPTTQLALSGGKASGTANFSFGMKRDFVQRYRSDGFTTTNQNSLILVFFAGNGSDSASPTLTGYEAQFYADYYYTDA